MWITTVLLAVIGALLAERSGLNFYEGFFAVVAGLLVLYLVGSLVFMLWMRSIFR